jgi:hypothetical protein
MTETDALPIEISPNGAKGLALMAPVLGLPLLLHALSGAVVGGLGFAVFSTVMSPLAGKILQAAKKTPIEIPPALDPAGQNASIYDSIPVTATFDVSVK